jgi:hypothetical protein
MPSIVSISASLSTVVATPSTIADDGAEESVIVVTCLDGSGDPIEGISAANVVLTLVSGTATLTQPTGVTNAVGQFDVPGSLVSATPGDVVVRATVAGRAVTQTPTVTVSGDPSFDYLTNLPVGYTERTSQVWASALPTPPATAYDNGWAIENNAGGSGAYFITASRTAGGFGPNANGALRFTVEAGVSGGGGGPRAEESFTAVDSLYISMPIEFSAMYAAWVPNAYKLINLQNTRILSLYRGTYGGAVATGHYVDFINGGSFYLNDSPGTGRGALTALQAGVAYEIELLLESSGRVRWWVRNVDAGTAPVLQGDYSGQTFSTLSYLAPIGQQGGNTQGNAPTSFTDDRGTISVYGEDD